MLNWNRAQDSGECIDSLLAQINVNLHIMVVDNGSIDNSVEFLNNRYPQIEILVQDRNLGFPAGMNKGIQYALSKRAQYIFLINNDTVTSPDMMEKLLNDMKPGVGIVAPAIFYAKPADRVWSIGGMINPILLEMPISSGKVARLPEHTIARDFVSGCAMLVKNEVFQKVGGFDERFSPAYYEDLDLCLRVRKAGFTILLEPQAKLWHKVSLSSGGECNPHERYLMARNSAIYFRKHMRFWQAPFILAYRSASALRWTARLIRRKDTKAWVAYMKGLMDGWFRHI